MKPIIKTFRHPKSLLRKLFICLIILVVSQGLLFGWFVWRGRNTPTSFGVSFSDKQARELGVDPEATLNALLDPNNLGFKQVRLMSYWDEGEPTRNNFDFSHLDWQFQMAERYGAKISLAIGVRQPRWPECHQPSWADQLAKDDWQSELANYISAVVNRYKTSPSLDSYQLENEFFIKAFGNCTDYDRQRLINEYNLVKKLDPKHEIIVSLSHNVFGLPVRQPEPDEYGISIYRRVYSTDYIHGYVTYPIPAWYFGLRAAWINLATGRNLLAHEYQLEPWGPGATGGLSIAEQDKSLSASDIAGRIGYIKATHIKQAYLWGGEWWYWRLAKQNDPSVMNAVRSAVSAR